MPNMLNPSLYDWKGMKKKINMGASKLRWAGNNPKLFQEFWVNQWYRGLEQKKKLNKINCIAKFE